LQVLTYTAPLVNYANSDEHRNSCASVGFCMLCEFKNHLIRVAKHNAQNGPIRPMSIIQRLSCISKNFKFGRQEDAHEFLRYVIEAFRKSCLAGKKNLDRFSKETTAINQIFGGLFRSQVTCLSCKKSSYTFDPMMELNLDIKESSTVLEAMKRAVRTEKLDGENKYSCERCKKKAVALKRGNIHTPPKILTLQLKRFDFQRLFGGKISKDVRFDESLDLSLFLSNKSDKPVLYKLYAVLVHSGFSCNSGHYYCYVKAANGIWYEMNDSRVSQVGLQTVLRAQAYLLFYSITGYSTSKTSFKANPKGAELVNLKPASTESKKNTSAVKDIDLQLFENSPSTLPSAEREKVRFSVSGIVKHNPMRDSNVVSKSKDSCQRSQSGNISKMPSHESSLATIRKEYDSSESESVPSSDRSSQICSQQASSAADTERNSASEEHLSQVSCKKSSPLSPPKAVNMEALHKKKVKTPNGVVNSTSKFGKWMPVKSCNSSFTPRSVLHRSLSDNSSIEKLKSSNRREIKRQLSTQADSRNKSAGKIEKTSCWNVKDNDRLDTPHGPVASSFSHTVPTTDQCRERTSSITSEAGSISTKTGEWDVHEKDLFVTSSAPYVQERHFAGWSVEDHKDKKILNDDHDRVLGTKNHNKVSKKLFGCVEDEEHRKKGKKRKGRHESRTTAEEYLDVSTKRIKEEDGITPASHKAKKKNKKKKKKKRSKRHEEDDHTDQEEKKERFSNTEVLKAKDSGRKNHGKKHGHKKKCKDAHVDPKYEDIVEDRESKQIKERSYEESRKRSKKNPTSLSKESSEELFASANGGIDTKIDDEDDGSDSRYSSMKSPRILSLSKHDSIKTHSNGHKYASKPNISTSVKDLSNEKEKYDLEGERLNTSHKKSKPDIPVKQWDEKPNISTSWNGSNDNTVLESLLSKKSQVTTWDNESSQTISYSTSGSSKRHRDRLDDEYDQGKVKKVKKHHGHRSKKCKDNPFQKLQNRRNIESNKR